MWCDGYPLFYKFSNMERIIVEKESFVMCGGKGCKCPVATFDKSNQNVEIHDDFGGKILLSFEELNLLVEKFKNDIDIRV